MLKFRPTNLTPKRASLTFNELQLIALIEKGLSDNSLRGYLYKRSSTNSKWRLKWFLMFENLLFYFDLGSLHQQQHQEQLNQNTQHPQHQAGTSKSPSKSLGASIKRNSYSPGSDYERGSLPGQRNNSSSSSSSKTFNSSSISGVSGHFLAHNEQNVGRSTTTTAGKTATSAANYSSLLNRKIGVIFLEGSYCARLSESAANFSGSVCAFDAQTVCRPTKNCPLSSEAESARQEQLGIAGANNKLSRACEEESELDCIFSLTWKKEGSKVYQFRTETEAECRTWVHAISIARYSTLLDEKEQLEQKYLHLSQIIESESTAKWQYSRQCEEFSSEIKKLRQEICLLRRQENRSNHLRLVLAKSAAIVDTIMKQQRRRQQRLETAATATAENENGAASAPRVGSEKCSSEIESQLVAVSGGRQRNSLAEKDNLSSLEEQSAAVRRARRCPTTTSHPLSHQQDELRKQSASLQMLLNSARVKSNARLKSGGQALRATEGQPNEKMHDGDSATFDTSKFDHDGDDDDNDDEEERALSVELKSVVEALNSGLLLSDCLLEAENSEEIRKIKKVQGFFRGWLCRRRWKQIVQEYIKSPHAESMRKRNNLVFRMVECEEEYVEQLALLISAFLRPIKMAASSQKPALSHDELNSIFLNSETLLFLHQIFLKGLTARMESWPTLVLGDLFNMLLPMLTIYQEYVRNHHFSLQVLAECKQREQFSLILRRLEEKPQLNGRTLETFLTYPMHQIPRYIICLHEILAHTPHNHVERKSLYEAQTKLEELSRQMHDEVSETENIRQNLAIERMIIGGCDILLDVNQVFVRQGILIQVVGSSSTHKLPKGRSRLASFTGRQQNRQQQQQQQQQQSDCIHTQLGQAYSGGSHQQTSDNQTKELIRQCFLFTNHLLLCTRTKDGKLHLLEHVGRIALPEVTLIENPLEFIQQQETMIANFESILQGNHCSQLSKQETNCAPTQQEQVRNSSCNSISDCRTDFEAPEGAIRYSGSDKRASTASVPAKWATPSAPTNQHNSKPSYDDRMSSHIDSEERLTNSTFIAQPTNTIQLREERTDSALQSYADQAYAGSKATISQLPSAKQQQTTSSRGRIAGFFANKLSNLTNLGGATIHSQQQQQQQQNHYNNHGSSSSAPPSPFCKRNQSRSSSNRNSTASSGTAFKHSGLFGEQRPYILSKDYAGCDFILLLEPTSKFGSSSISNGALVNTSIHSAGPIIIHLVAPSPQEKAAWMSDISQCIDNVHFNDLFHGSVNDSATVTMNKSVRTDPRLYKDDVDIKFSRALNSCKLPQIRYASKERLFERLTDLRFLSIDFLNTFLLTYRVFTTAEDVLEALKSVHYNCDRYCQQNQTQFDQAQQTAHTESNTTLSDHHSHLINDSNKQRDNNIKLGDLNEVNDSKRPMFHESEVVASTNSDELVAQSSSVLAITGEKKGEVDNTNPDHRSSPSSNYLRVESSRPSVDPIRYLLETDSQYQKRRSTISTLTPITGSTSSSLANLNCPFKTKSSLKNQIHTLMSERESNLVARKQSECDSSRTSELLNNLLEQQNEEQVRELFRKDDSFNTNRLRSSSVSNSRWQQQTPNNFPNSNLSLNVPSARQTRASSFSHLHPINRERDNIMGNRVADVEHWRLSYKKTTLGVGGSTTRRASSSGATIGDNARNGLSVSALAGANAIVLGSSKHSHIKVEKSGNLKQPTTNVDSSCGSRCINDCDDDFRFGLNVAEIDCDEKQLTEFGKESEENRVVLCDPPPARNPCEIFRPSLDRPQKYDISYSSASSTSLSSESTASGSPLMSYSQQSVLVESNLNNSDSSIGEWLPSSSRHRKQGQEREKLPSIDRAHNVSINSRSKKTSRLESANRQSKNKNFVKNLTLKEIEFAESKTLDCDTSADEDKVSSSSAENNNDFQTHNRNELIDRGRESDGHVDDDDDENSFKILSKLNCNINYNPENIDSSDDMESICLFPSDVALDASDPNGSWRMPKRQGDKTRQSSYTLQRRKCSNQSSSTSITRPRRGVYRLIDESDSKSNIWSAGKPSDLKQETQTLGNNIIKSLDNDQKLANQGPLVDREEAKEQQRLDESKTVPSLVAEAATAPQAATEQENLKSTLGGSSAIVMPLIEQSSSQTTTPRSSFQHHANDLSASSDRVSKAGVIVSSSLPRVTSRRSSTASAAAAFAAATAASNNPVLTQPLQQVRQICSNPLHQQRREWLAPKQSFDRLGQCEYINCSCSNLSSNGSASSPGQLQVCLTSPHNSQAHHNRRASKIYEMSPQHRPATATMNPNSSYSSYVNSHPNPQAMQFQACVCLKQPSTASLVSTPPNSYLNQHSEPSSICNSRASSRLSSSAGLEYSGAGINTTYVNIDSVNHHQFPASISGLSRATGCVQAVNRCVHEPNQAIFCQQPTSSLSSVAQQQQQRSTKRDTMHINVRSVATIRVLSVLRHWISKQSQDFANDPKLSFLVQDFLQELIMDTSLLPAEHKAAAQLQQLVQKAASSYTSRLDLDLLLAPPSNPSSDSIETLSALEIAEGMTYLDHKIFLSIRSEEFLGQAWMKIDKALRAPHILLITKRFNDVSRLVSSEIIRVTDLNRRVAVIEKWTNVAHICRVVHNFNGALQICAAFTNSAVFRLKKTWDKISKTTKTTIDQLQNLVSTDSRFRNMRDAISRCDPPSIPYVGMYLTDLSFIEEGTPNYSPEGLLNFSKMRMIAHVIREIQHLQNGNYKIELNPRVANYLLDDSRHLQDDEMYRCSLEIEPRSSGGGKNVSHIMGNVVSNLRNANSTYPTSNNRVEIKHN